MSQKKQRQDAYQKTLITPAVLQKALLDARSTLDDQAIFLSAAYQKQLNSLGCLPCGAHRPEGHPHSGHRPFGIHPHWL